MRPSCLRFNLVLATAAAGLWLCAPACSTSGSRGPDTKEPYAFVGGDFSTDIDGEVQPVADAAAAALARRGFADSVVRSGPDRATVRTRGGGKDAVSVRLQKAGPGTTRATIRYGVFGDEVQSAKLADELRTRPTSPGIGVK